ncbi:MAG TPA: DUF305 domain-containing protein [Roseiflexaceae bacterium]|nr:DUF305 domain-containing protein [Roseiflexaceae bacterium]
MTRNNAYFISRSAQAAMRLLLTLVLALGVFALAAPPAVASAPAPDKSTANFEIDFMQDMIDHHAMAVEMAELCLQKAVHTELRALCQNIIATQTEEIQIMQSWLADWYGITYEPEMTRGDMRKIEKLASLSGSEFEIAFMEMMIKHHTQAIQEAEKCVDRAYHPELVNLCENIIATQSAEIEQMQTWLCAWYAICKES